MRRRFFVEGFENGSAVLAGDAANHLGRVLRAEAGELYELSDGESIWLSKIEKVSRDEIHFALIERQPVPIAALRIILLLAIVKFDHFEWAIEKATELGVDEIVPLLAQRSEHGLIAAAGKRAYRWQRILMESAQQSRRLRVPSLREAEIPLKSFAAANTTVPLLLSERVGAQPMRSLLEPAAAESNSGGVPNITIAIGPEGGWTAAEFSAAAAAGFLEVGLGINILRTETAVCAALSAIQYAFGRPQKN